MSGERIGSTKNEWKGGLPNAMHIAGTGVSDCRTMAHICEGTQVTKQGGGRHMQRTDSVTYVVEVLSVGSLEFGL
jgi:hypothetical protein